MFTPQDLEKIVEFLREFCVIVEGKKDKKALKALGIENVIEISGKSLDKLSEALDKSERYVILTDFDHEGNKKNKIISEVLEKNKIVFNPKLRLLFRKIFGITKIEELMKFSKLKEDVYHGKISTIDYKILNRSRILRKWFSRETRRDWGNIWANRRTVGAGS